MRRHEGRSETEIWVSCEVSPLSIPSESLAGGGVRKKCRQNLDVKELRGQNLENKGVRGAGESAIYTASASTMLS